MNYYEVFPYYMYEATSLVTAYGNTNIATTVTKVYMEIAYQIVIQ